MPDRLHGVSTMMHGRMPRTPTPSERNPVLRRPIASLAALAAASLVLTACGGSDAPSTPAAGGSSSAAPADFAAVLAEAKGQTVNWHMYGGDDTINTFVNGYVADKLKALGVTLNQVKVTDTVTVVDTILAEKQVGKKDGSVDAVWINGENFATGKQADAWFCGYDRGLENAKYVDFDNPAIANDFGLPVEGCESVWQQANSALVYDSAKLGAGDVKSVSTLFDWVKAHPGQFTYPAPPDFTGSMAVRTFLYDTAGGPEALSGEFDEAKYQPFAEKTFARLNEIAPSLYKKGATYPASQTDVEKLYANGEVAAFLTYGPGGVGEQVEKGVYPKTTREAVFENGNISNYNFLAIPANSPHKAAAQVLQNVLLDPMTQLEFYKVSGTFPAIDLAKVDPAVKAQFDAVQTSESVLPLATLSENAQPELTSGYVTRVEKDWKTDVLQK
ncbi:MAG: putative secreted protein [Frankiales bacterium]|nr:putative secreted protein [Frankiales bacterium]